MIGQTFSHYVIVEKLGEGGMGLVYRALDTRLNRPVAIKVLAQDAAATADRIRRFTQEAKAASALNHPNIITVYDIDQAGAVDFIAMEYVAGTTLDRLIGRKGLSLRDALKYAVQIADALAAAHAAGIVHRDLKPANVMVTQKGLVKVLDFGIAKLTEQASGEVNLTTVTSMAARSETEEGTILGTVAYMSPEQAEGRAVDARSDIFAFGSLLYEMVTGQRAFERDTKLSTLSAILHDEPEVASQVADALPRELDRIIAHCLRKDPNRRFQHLDDVKTLLEELKEEETHALAINRGAAPAVRRRAAIAALGAVLVAAAAGGMWRWLGRDRSTAAPPPDTVPRLSTGGPPSSNPEANRYFEAAVQLKVTLDLPRGRAMLGRALELDPHFAEARAWYAFTNWLMLDGGYSNDSALLYEAEDEVRRALKDDPQLVHAHAVLAAIYFAYGRKELVPAEVQQALKVNGTDEYALHWLMHYHHFSGDYAAADRVGRQNVERNPLFFPTRMILGDMLRQQGDLAGATREQQRILEQDPQNPYGLRFLARVHLDSGDPVKARQTLDSGRPPDRQSYASRLLFAIALAQEGRRAEAYQLITDDVLKWGSLMALMTSEVATFYAVAGEESNALDWLDRAVRNGDERSEYFRRDPLLATVRDHPRFHQILQSIAYRRQQRKSLP